MSEAELKGPVRPLSSYQLRRLEKLLELRSAIEEGLAKDPAYRPTHNMVEPHLTSSSRSFLEKRIKATLTKAYQLGNPIKGEWTLWVDIQQRINRTAEMYAERKKQEAGLADPTLFDLYPETTEWRECQKFRVRRSG